MKKLLITQSNYIPWKGYFDCINQVNEFIIYDDAQYTKGDWRNRNKIKTKNGLQWLTIPVNMKGRLEKKISDIKISDKNWNKKHWATIKLHYSTARFYKDYKDFFERLYFSCNSDYLSEINFMFLNAICNLLEIKTNFKWSSEFELIGDKSEKLLNICLDTDATEYYSGPAAKKYLNTKIFEAQNIKVKWFDYSGYREYPQLYPPFEHSVSILDLIFNTGAKAKEYLKGF
jgi:hypothetical protein